MDAVDIIAVYTRYIFTPRRGHQHEFNLDSAFFFLLILLIYFLFFCQIHAQVFKKKFTRLLNGAKNVYTQVTGKTCGKNARPSLWNNNDYQRRVYPRHIVTHTSNFIQGMFFLDLVHVAPHLIHVVNVAVG